MLGAGAILTSRNKKRQPDTAYLAGDANPHVEEVTMFKHILMPTNGSEHSERAIERGIELAKLCGAKVTGIHVMPDFRLAMADESSFDPSMQEKAEQEARTRAENFLAFVQK